MKRKTHHEGISSVAKTKRNLPHWQEPGSTYFITWTTKDRHELSAEERTIVLNAIRHWDETRWMVYAAVVMPDHVHLIVQPMAIPGSSPPAVYSLEQLIHSVKSFSAHEINLLRKQRGVVWLDEREDRILRNEQEVEQKWDYLRCNPQRLGLAASAEEYPWFYQRSGLKPDPRDPNEGSRHRRDAGATRRDAGATPSTG